MEDLETTGRSSPLFSLTFQIPLEDYIRFHLVIGAENEKKGRKKTVLLGWVEFVIGVLLLISLFVSDTESGLFFYFMIAVMILMGLYSITYYRFFYRKSLEKVLAKQHASTPYLQSDLTIDLYEDKLTEHVEDKQADTPWNAIHEIKSTDALLLLMLDTKRCLLIPKSQLSPVELEKLESLLDEVSEKYGKPRYAV
ncbi:YcxB family protein [Marasmitruncus massiliensis]|uniref:YcxB family protein n=1 Tax=Marasmitruncus massiliensis TaxID=1944642 RepID=UPI000C7A686E|nr:YcxB family protein [Marasmitruncus massiliensis]